MIQYLTGARNETLDRRLPEFHGRMGLLAQPLTSVYVDRIEYSCLGIDNGCFTPSGRARFDKDAYLAMSAKALKLWRERLLFVTCPDVPFQWKQTLDGIGFARDIRRIGCPAAIVLQDGATVSNVPWSDIDAVFIGGTTEWKLSLDACDISQHAVKLGKISHMGRVNSKSRLAIAESFDCHSADGTFLLYEPINGIDRMKAWFQ